MSYSNGMRRLLAVRAVLVLVSVMWWFEVLLLLLLSLLLLPLEEGGIWNGFLGIVSSPKKQTCELVGSCWFR